MLLTSAGLAPQYSGDESQKGKLHISETEVEVTLDFDDFHECLKYAVGTPFYKSFVLDILSNQVYINSVRIRTSDPSVPYKFMMFEDQPPENELDWHREDIIQMEKVEQRIFTWEKVYPFTTLIEKAQIRFSAE